MAPPVTRAAAVKTELAAQSEREVCTHPPGLRDEPATERNAAPSLPTAALSRQAEASSLEGLVAH